MQPKHILAEDFVPCGRLGKTTGNQGYLKAFFDPSCPIPQKGDFIFLKVHGLPVPFEVTFVGEKGDFLIGFQGLDTPEKASIFVNTEILIEKRLAELNHSEIPKDLVGFSLWEGEYFLGIIIEIKDFPGQLMLIVQGASEEEILVPLVEEWIHSLDLESRKLHMTLPDGLLS
jgi:16S rRNA processing protein RimM